MSLLLQLDLSLLEVSTHNVRKNIDPTCKAITSLAENIKEYGQLSAIWVKRMANSDHYEIFAGQRRFLACRLLGIKTMKCEVYPEETDILKMLFSSIIENTETGYVYL